MTSTFQIGHLAETFYFSYVLTIWNTHTHLQDKKKSKTLYWSNLPWNCGQNCPVS